MSYILQLKSAFLKMCPMLLEAYIFIHVLVQVHYLPGCPVKV